MAKKGYQAPAVVGLRFTPGEKERFEQVFDKVQAMLPVRLSATILLRHLLGLETGLLTQDDIDFFQGKSIKTK